MPLYEYKCRDCGQVFEFLAGSLRNAEPACPHCHSSNLERLISAPALLKTSASAHGATCCGRTERCDTPQCSTGEGCRRQ